MVVGLMSVGMIGFVTDVVVGVVGVAVVGGLQRRVSAMWVYGMGQGAAA